MVIKTSEDVDAALKEQLREGEGQKEQVEKMERRPEKNSEETTQMNNYELVMVGKIKKIYEEMMLLIIDFLSSDAQLLAINIKGPTGVGKTKLVYYIAKQLSRVLNMKVPVVLAQCNNTQDYHEILGYKEIAYEGDKLTIQFVAGPIVEAINDANKYGVAILLLDEINGLANDAQKLANPLLDGRGMVKYGDIEAKIHNGKKLIVIGTMNELQSGYYGINPLNIDLERRFEYTFILPYPNPDDEFEIIDKMVGGNTESSIIKAAIKLANHTRSEWEGPPISTSMLIAFISAFKKFSKSNIPNALMEAFEVSILNHFEEQLRKALKEKAIDVGLLPITEDKKDKEG